MKKFYLIFLIIPVLAILLLRQSLWWFVGGIAAVMAFVAYQFYASRFKSMKARIDVLETEAEDLNDRLDNAVIKEQRANSEAENIRRMKEQLLSVISHEVRTPMNGIIGSALLMEETSLTADQEDHLATIRHCGESLITTVNTILVNDILDISKIQQAEGKLEYKDFNLADMTEEVIGLFADKANHTGIELLYNIDENVPGQIIGDTKRIRQVLMNLVENAVNFTREGEVVINIHYLNDGKHNELKFEVQDSGVGIAKDQVKQLFAGIPSKKINKYDDNNSGLGLMICKKLVDLMGGTIDAISEKGKGSTFSFAIPVTPSLKIVRSDARESEMEGLEGKSILIVSANSASRYLLSKQLKTWKISSITAASEDEALQILSTNKDISAVITDLYLPVKDGMQLAKSIKAGSSIPLIGMKATSDKRYGQAPDLFVSILNKPFRKHTLRDHILNIYSANTANKQAENSNLSELFAEQCPLNILIAEDNLINQKIAVKILTSLGYKPALVKNGKEAVEIVSNEKYDIILMDVQMPEMNGLEATRLIRTCLEVQPVIIAMTANVMQGDRDDCMQAGMDDYMSKPIELKELLNQLEKWYRVTKEKRKAS